MIVASRFGFVNSLLRQSRWDRPGPSQRVDAHPPATLLPGSDTAVCTPPECELREFRAFLPLAPAPPSPPAKRAAMPSLPLSTAHSALWHLRARSRLSPRRPPISDSIVLRRGTQWSDVFGAP